MSIKINMQSNILQVIPYSIPSSPEIIRIRQFQEPSLYPTLGISILKLIARFRRDKIIINHMLAMLKNFQNEINEYFPLYKAYTNYFIELTEHIGQMDNEVQAFDLIKNYMQENNFLYCISSAIKGLMLTLTKKKAHVTPDLENNKNFKTYNTIFFTSLMEKFGIATKLYYFNSPPETFYPNKMSTYPLMHILFNDVQNNGLNLDSYIEVYNDGLLNLESYNTITIQELEAYPYSYSNNVLRPIIQTTIPQEVVNVKMPASLLDDILTEIIRVNNNTMPHHLYQMLKPFADNSQEISNLPSFRRIASQQSVVLSFKCCICVETKEIRFLSHSNCRDCKICNDCRRDSLNQCRKCLRHYNPSEISSFNNNQ